MKISELLGRFPLGSTWLAPLEGGDILVPVKIIDLRSTFGRIDAEVTPLGGKGTTWLDSAKLQPLEELEVKEG